MDTIVPQQVTDDTESGDALYTQVVDDYTYQARYMRQTLVPEPEAGWIALVALYAEHRVGSTVFHKSVWTSVPMWNQLCDDRPALATVLSQLKDDVDELEHRDDAV